MHAPPLPEASFLGDIEPSAAVAPHAPDDIGRGSGGGNGTGRESGGGGGGGGVTADMLGRLRAPGPFGSFEASSMAADAVNTPQPDAAWPLSLFPTNHGSSSGANMTVPLAPAMTHGPAMPGLGPDLGSGFQSLGDGAQFQYPSHQPQPIDNNLPLNPALDSGAAGMEFDFPFDFGQADFSIDNFFRETGAWRPPAPCTHCRRLRLHCFILQTTAANPNPVTSCSSCVALFRDCSLAEREKRHASRFETLDPVIGGLHGVTEEEELTGGGAGGGGEEATWDQNVQLTESATESIPMFSTKTSDSRAVRRTQVLRDWFARNIDYPYPSEEGKTALAESSGLSRTQVIHWFTNARRRHRMSAEVMKDANTLFPQGSPMPQSVLSNMTPFERWRQSPPEEEPVAESAIQRALNTSVGDGGASDGQASSISGDSIIGAPVLKQRSSSGSASSCNSYLSNNSSLSLSHSARGSFKGRNPSNWSVAGTSRSRQARISECRFCQRKFSKKYDCVRHEASVHSTGDSSWVCSLPIPPQTSSSVWRVGKTNPECIFCGHESPSEDHFKAHEFEACAARAVSDRSFFRKDHLWQHLYKFHGCRKWEGWKPDLSLLQHKQEDGA